MKGGGILYFYKSVSLRETGKSCDFFLSGPTWEIGGGVAGHNSDWKTVFPFVINLDVIKRPCGSQSFRSVCGKGCFPPGTRNSVKRKRRF